MEFLVSDGIFISSRIQQNLWIFFYIVMFFLLIISWLVIIERLVEYFHLISPLLFIGLVSLILVIIDYLEGQ